jgi:hypothetical protein
MSNEFTKATFNLPIEDLQALKKLAKANHVSVTSLVRKAIGTELYLNKIEATGSKLLIEENGVIKQITRKF